MKTVYLVKCLFTVYVKCSDGETASLVKTYVDLIQGTSLSGSVHILTTETPPTGCAVQTVSAKCETHFMIKVCCSLIRFSVS